MIFAIFDQGEVGFNEIFDLNPDENTSYLESLMREKLRPVPKGHWKLARLRRVGFRGRDGAPLGPELVAERAAPSAHLYLR